MQVNFNTYNTTPFTAKFSNDEETVKILKTYAAQSPVQTKTMIDLLKTSNTNDVISISNDFGNINGSPRRIIITNRTESGELVSKRFDHIKYLYSAILGIKLSDDTSAKDFLPKLTKMPANTKNDIMEYALLRDFMTRAKLDKTRKDLQEKTNEIEKLEREVSELKHKEQAGSYQFIDKYIDANV